MNEEYLWSKTGSDPEIERLEGILNEFHFEPGPTPVFVSQPTEARFGSIRNRVGWILGIATPSFALALFGFWFFTAGAVGDLQVRALQSLNVVEEAGSVAETPVPVKFAEDKGKANPNVKAIKVQPTNVKTIYRSRRSKADRTDSLTAKHLTSEEKYAYDRLMLALSIAGTKLKVVQDTIDRSGDLEKRSIRNDK